MKELPIDWEWRLLSEVAEVRLGRQRSPRNHSGPHMRPYLRAANIDWNGLALDDVKKMNFTDEEMSVYRLEQGDILLSEASGSAGEVGKPALWNAEIDDCAFQNTLLRVRSLGPDPRFLLNFFKFLALSGEFAKASRGVGIHHIGKARLADWPVPIPPPAKQREIVNTLDEHLSRLAVTKVELQRATRKVAGLQHRTLVGLLAEPGEDTVLSDLLLTTIGGLWGEPPGESDLDAHVIRVTELGRLGTLDPSTAAVRSLKESQFASRALQKGDLLLEKSGGGPTTPVGRVGLVEALNGPSVCSNFMQLMRPNPLLVLPRWLHLYLNGFHLAGRTSAMQKASTNIRNIKGSEYLKIRLVVPPIEKQHALVAYCEEVLGGADRLRTSIAMAQGKASALQRSVLQAAFTGELTGGFGSV